MSTGWQRYPNANYPEGYAESNMVKATGVSTNIDGGLLSITEAGAGLGPLKEVTGADVRGVTLHDTYLTDPVADKSDEAPLDKDEATE